MFAGIWPALSGSSWWPDSKSRPRSPGLTLQMMLVNSLPVLSKWSREDYLDLFSRVESELGLYDLEGIFWELGGLSRSAVATLPGGRREPRVLDWPGNSSDLEWKES